MDPVAAASVTSDAIENHEITTAATTAAITPTEAHFVRCHFPVPVASGTVQIGGAVANALGLPFAALRAAATRTLPVTLECAGNGRASMAPLPPGQPWKHGAVSTAVWSGVPLRLLLERAELRDDTREILTVGADGFERALPIDLALDPDVIVATEMNGAPIPPLHGGPARLIVPGWYGMASVKWLRALIALTRPFTGRFQTEEYVYDDAPVTTMRVNSLIVAPREDAVVAGGRLRVWGRAWSGDAPIVAVEVSFDAGPWRAARLERAAGARAWVGWHADVTAARGRHSLRARARDRAGQVQPETPRWNRRGYGNNMAATVIFTCA